MAVFQWFVNGRWWPKVVTTFGVVCLVISLTGCERGKEGEKAKQAPPAPPPPAVVVAEVIQKTVPIYSEFVARTDAVNTVEIRARVQAVLEAQHFTEGTVVKKDQAHHPDRQLEEGLRSEHTGVEERGEGRRYFMAA